MSIKCLMNGMEVNYPCSHVCALFGDCVTAFEAQKKENVRTNADRIRAMNDEELAEQLIQYRDDWGDYCTHKGCYATQKEAVEAEIEWLKQQEE